MYSDNNNRDKFVLITADTFACGSNVSNKIYVEMKADGNYSHESAQFATYSSLLNAAQNGLLIEIEVSDLNDTGNDCQFRPFDFGNNAAPIVIYYQW